jgi:hypothetical protein
MMSDSSEPVAVPRRDAEFDPTLAALVRAELRSWGPVVERLWFGGIVFSLRGEMVVGVRESSLLVRLKRSVASSLAGSPSVTPFVLAEVPMPGWFRVDRSALGGNGLREWVGRAVAYVSPSAA